MNASVFDWNFLSGGVIGSGTFDATLSSGSQYNVTAVSGTIAGQNITSLLSPGIYLGNDNLLFYPSGGQFNQQLSNNGISFGLSGGTQRNLSDAGGAYTYQTSSGAFTNNGQFSAVSRAVPEPSVSGFLLLVVGGCGLLAWRRHIRHDHLSGSGTV